MSADRHTLERTLAGPPTAGARWHSFPQGMELQWGLQGRGPSQKTGSPGVRRFAAPAGRRDSQDRYAWTRSGNMDV